MTLALKSFDTGCCYFYKSDELKSLINDYLIYFNLDYLEKNESITKEEIESKNVSRMFSEIDGTLRIEGVSSTRKQISDIYYNKKELLDKNDIIVRNMINGYKFIASKPIFNEENLYKLYNILSIDSLDENSKLNGIYRDDEVYVGKDNGCPKELIKDCMDSLFVYVNNELNKRNHYLPFIVHYYIVYIHPYFDYNGRTARMVMLWISMLSDIADLLPTFLSEAINDDKKNYYNAISNSRSSNNDLTYFITYLYDLSNNYYLVYKNISKLKEVYSLMGESFTKTEQQYIKRIMIYSKNGWFNYKTFINFCGIDISKQGALKILNNFLNLNILVSRINSKNEKIFKLNENLIFFE